MTILSIVFIIKFFFTSMIMHHHHSTACSMNIIIKHHIITKLHVSCQLLSITLFIYAALHHDHLFIGILLPTRGDRAIPAQCKSTDNSKWLCLCWFQKRVPTRRRARALFNQAWLMQFHEQRAAAHGRTLMFSTSTRTASQLTKMTAYLRPTTVN
jgi:hypothetical protein